MASKSEKGCYNENFGEPPSGHIDYDKIKFTGPIFSRSKLFGVLFQRFLVIIGPLILLTLILVAIGFLHFRFGEYNRRVKMLDVARKWRPGKLGTNYEKKNKVMEVRDFNDEKGKLMNLEQNNDYMKNMINQNKLEKENLDSRKKNPAIKEENKEKEQKKQFPVNGSVEEISLDDSMASIKKVSRPTSKRVNNNKRPPSSRKVNNNGRPTSKRINNSRPSSKRVSNNKRRPSSKRSNRSRIEIKPKNILPKLPSNNLVPDPNQNNGQLNQNNNMGMNYPSIYSQSQEQQNNPFVVPINYNQQQRENVINNQIVMPAIPTIYQRNNFGNEGEEDMIEIEDKFISKATINKNK